MYLYPKKDIITWDNKIIRGLNGEARWVNHYCPKVKKDLAVQVYTDACPECSEEVPSIIKLAHMLKINSISC